MNRFVAIDVETANADLSSICQIGLVAFADGEPELACDTLVNPEDFFDPVNTSIHGITEAMVTDAPTLSVVMPLLSDQIAGQVVVSHTLFDRVAVCRAFERAQCATPDCHWLDSARVVRRAWSQFTRRGYGLASVAAEFGIEFRHHHAAEDARVAGIIVARAIRETGIQLSQWRIRALQPIGGSTAIARDGNPDGPLFGEVAVFTGALSVPRREAADRAARAGCTVASVVNRQTTLLVVGDQDIRRLAGHDKSSKHRKVESLVESGQPIRILAESDFDRLLLTSS